MVHECSFGHGQITALDCQKCRDKTPRNLCRLVAKFDEHNLAVGQPHKRFNPSLIAEEGGYVLAYRDGWAGSEIYCVELDPDFKVCSDVKRLNLRHPQAAYGREDPRLFWLGGHLHVAYAGVMGNNQPRHTNVLFARIARTQDGSKRSFNVEDIFHPQIGGRNLWEKNHGYFDHEGACHAVYSIAPHRVMQVWGERTEMQHQTPWSPQGWVTELRGGAAPVRVGEEYWSFFHSRYERGVRVYCTGLYTFEARPPFRPKRIIPYPIDTASINTKPHDQYAAVVFAGGAVRHKDEWVLACGIHDRFCELRAFDHKSLESRLVPIELREWGFVQNGSGI